MKVYVVTCVNEDAWVSIVGVYATAERALMAMDIDRKNTAESLEQEGYVVSTGRDENGAIIKYGNDHSYMYEVFKQEVRK